MATELKSAVSFDKTLADWVSKEQAAVELINAIGSLLYTKSVELVLFRNHLVDQSVSEVLNLHKYAAEVVKKPIFIFDTAELAKSMCALDLAPSKIDIGKLAAEWMEEKNNYASKKEFLENKLKNFIGNVDFKLTPKDVVLFGFGRIGRICARELIKQAGKGQQLRLRAIVTRGNSDEEIRKRAALLRMDSVHGPFKGQVDIDLENKCLIINGQIVHMIAANNPEDINYEDYGIHDALLIDNTGVFKDRNALSRHLQAKGIEKVILTAPGKEVPNIVYGVNHKSLDIEKEKIFSAASCTTNAIVPVLKVINDFFGIEKGHIETVHAYTNDQNLLDNYHKKKRVVAGRQPSIWL